MGEVGFSVEKLTNRNHHTCKFSMEMKLMRKDFWHIVQCIETVDGNTTDEEQRKFKKRENLALWIICLSVTTSLQI